MASDSESKSFFTLKSFIIFAVIISAVVGAGVYFAWASIPESIRTPISNVRDTMIQQVGLLGQLPAKFQIPVLSSAATFALVFAIATLIFIRSNMGKTIVGLATVGIAGGAVYYYKDELWKYNPWGIKEYPEIDKKLAALGKLQQTGKDTGGDSKKLGEPVETVEGNRICTTQTYEVGQNFNKMMLLDPTTDVIYPGALIKGETIGDGRYTPIIADRHPITISASLENIDGETSADISDPKLSTVRAAIKKILNKKVTGSTAAKNTFEITEINSSDQLKIAMGANYSYGAGVASVKAGFNFNSDKQTSKYLIKFIQSYYTIDMDSPKNPSNVFKDPEGFDLAKLGSVAPMYVASVTYGRMAYFTIESSSSTTDMGGTLNLAFKSGVHSGGFDFAGQNTSSLSTARISGTIIGGSGSDASNAVWDVQGIKNYINKGGNWSHESPAAPLSYKLRYLSDNSVGNVLLSTTYTVRNCVEMQDKQSTYRITLTNLRAGADASSDFEVCGDISVTAVSFVGNNPPQSETKRIWNTITYGPGGNWKTPGQTSYTKPIAKGASVALNKEVQFTFEDVDPLRSYIEIGGRLIEADSGLDPYNDLIGTTSKKVFFREAGIQGAASGPKSLTFSNGTEGSAFVDFTLTLVK